MAKASQSPVRIADLVENGGVANNAERLIDAVYGSRPAPLMKAIGLPHFSRVHAARRAENPQYQVPEMPKLELADVEKAAGIDGDDVQVVSASIHGSDLEHAWVVYVAEDGVGSHFKGCYPYSDHGGRGKSKQHTSEAEHFAETAIGRQLAEQRAAGEDDAVKTTRRTRRPPAAAADDGDGDGDGGTGDDAGDSGDAGDGDGAE